MNQLRLFLFASCLFLFSCSKPSPVEVVRTFENYENISFSTTSTEIEFVKDSTEFVKYIGNADYDPISIFKIEEKIYNAGLYSYPYLNIRGYSYLDNVILNKIEIHYKHVRRFGELVYQSPSYSSSFYQNSIYTREPIAEDSIDIKLINQQDSVIEVNANYLKVTGLATTRMKLAGNAHHFDADISASLSKQNTFVLNFGNLVTDSSFVKVYVQYGYSFYINHYIRIDVQANNFLDIQTASLISDPSTCPTCICEIYYKGHPTILNRDSLDSRVVIIDNN